MNHMSYGDWAWTIAIVLGVLIAAEQAWYEYKESPRNKHRKR